MKVMLNYVSQAFNSHPELSHYHQCLLHHWSEESNFHTNRFVSLKRIFWYIIWPPIFKFDFRYCLWSSVSSSSRFWMVLVLSFMSLSGQDVNFHVSFISLGQRTRKLCEVKCLNAQFSSRIVSLSSISPQPMVQHFSNWYGSIRLFETKILMYHKSL